MKKYIYQKFLFQCDYEEINLNNIPNYGGDLNYINLYGVQYNLFDYYRKIYRKIELSSLEDMIDTENDWKLFVSNLKEVDVLIILDENKKLQNPIITQYKNTMLKAIIYRLSEDVNELLVYYNFALL